jgi:hypothetical protein
MRIIRTLAFLMISLALVGSAQAQTGADVKIKIQRKGFDQFPIAVEDFSTVFGAASPGDSVMASRVSSHRRGRIPG